VRGPGLGVDAAARARSHPAVTPQRPGHRCRSLRSGRDASTPPRTPSPGEGTCLRIPRRIGGPSGSERSVARTHNIGRPPANGRWWLRRWERAERRSVQSRHGRGARRYGTPPQSARLAAPSAAPSRRARWAPAASSSGARARWPRLTPVGFIGGKHSSEAGTVGRCVPMSSRRCWCSRP
jgi:hypothetical protein